jgi:hypothetical protein
VLVVITGFVERPYGYSFQGRSGTSGCAIVCKPEIRTHSGAVL